MAKIKLGATLAGELWLIDMAFLFDADSRFARGKTYFNKGFIKKLSFDDSIVSARVKGTYGRRHKIEANYRANCNCYDYYDHTSPCKHIMALWFALCTEIDNNPLLLLKLHNGNDYYRYFYQLCRVGYLSINANSLIPSNEQLELFA